MKLMLTGGSANGKSTLAERLAIGLPGPHYYLAAMKPYGPEALVRIQRHRVSHDPRPGPPPPGPPPPPSPATPTGSPLLFHPPDPSCGRVSATCWTTSLQIVPGRLCRIFCGG